MGSEEVDRLQTSALEMIAGRDAAIERLRAALEPFAEIARRLGWATLEDDAPELIEHVLEAPADDIKLGAVCVLHVSCFAEAARVLRDEQ